MPDTENEGLIAEAQSMVGDVPEQVEAIVLSMIFQRHYIQPSGDVDNNDECVCGGWSSGAMEPGWDDHLGEVAVEAGFRLAFRPPVPAENEQTEIDILVEAIRLTVEYVGNDALPAVEGWSWFDALMKVRPEVARRFEQNPIRFPAPVTPQVTSDPNPEPWARAAWEADLPARPSVEGEREALIELLESAQHAPSGTHDAGGNCLACPVPLHALGSDEIADALLEGFSITRKETKHNG